VPRAAAHNDEDDNLNRHPANRRPPIGARRSGRRNRTISRFGKYMDRELEALGKTQTELMMTAKFTPTAYTAWKFGDSAPTPESLARIARALMTLAGEPQADDGVFRQRYSRLMVEAGRGDYILDSSTIGELPERLRAAENWSELVATLMNVPEEELELAIAQAIVAVQTYLRFRRP
jgi:transcriptional regulator with XRE-family HTH domain